MAHNENNIICIICIRCMLVGMDQLGKRSRTPKQQNGEKLLTNDRKLCEGIVYALLASPGSRWAYTFSVTLCLHEMRHCCNITRVFFCGYYVVSTPSILHRKSQCIHKILLRNYTKLCGCS